jgi:hypothetical protein
MVRNATGWVTGMRDRNGTASPAGRTIGSGAGGAPNCGTSESFQPTGGAIDGTPVVGAALPLLVNAGAGTVDEAAAVGPP